MAVAVACGSRVSIITSATSCWKAVIGRQPAGASSAAKTAPAVYWLLPATRPHSQVDDQHDEWVVGPAAVGQRCRGASSTALTGGSRASARDTEAPTPDSAATDAHSARRRGGVPGAGGQHPRQRPAGYGRVRRSAVPRLPQNDAQAGAASPRLARRRLLPDSGRGERRLLQVYRGRAGPVLPDSLGAGRHGGGAVRVRSVQDPADQREAPTAWLPQAVAPEAAEIRRQAQRLVSNAIAGRVSLNDRPRVFR
eukprot:scaffold52844_cov63-Phaeocystis_antarctica.AAC.3